jgi:WD repeat-containing protein 23
MQSMGSSTVGGKRGGGGAKPVGILSGHIDGLTFLDSRGVVRHLISNIKDQSFKLLSEQLFFFGV